MYYVYQLLDPETMTPFYIGKGKGDRAFFHLKNKRKTNNPLKDSKIASIRDKGSEPIVSFVQSDLDEHSAYQLEESLIIKFGRIGIDEDGILTNRTLHSRPPSQKGKKWTFSEEHRRKLSEALKGKPKKTAPWNKGLTMDRDARLKQLSENRSKTGNSHLIGKKYDQERVDKVRQKLLGRSLPSDQKQKMSAAKKGKTWEEIYGVEGAAARRIARKQKSVSKVS